MMTLKELREKYCYTQKQVMDAIGMKSRTNYSRVEHRVYKPRLTTRRKIANYFKVEPWDIDF
jgi:transcriptional regulator with XRE-family HTH domain